MIGMWKRWRAEAKFQRWVKGTMEVNGVTSYADLMQKYQLDDAGMRAFHAEVDSMSMGQLQDRVANPPRQQNQNLLLATNKRWVELGTEVRKRIARKLADHDPGLLDRSRLNEFIEEVENGVVSELKQTLDEMSESTQSSPHNDSQK